MPATTDFNISPYYDDYTESKKFHRILFRPSFAVQARELTQSQTILQNQIERVGDHLFKQGAMVIPGQVSIDTNYTAVKLTSKSASSIDTYNGSTITGGTSGVIAEVIGVAATDGTDPDTLFVKYNKTGTDNSAVVFTDGETITSDASGTPTAVVDTTATGSAAGVQSGVYYLNGYFVQVDSSTLVLDKYTNTPSYRVGFTVTESFVTPNDDATLNDNAQGSSNANAPGAHRFKSLLTLAKKSLTSTEDSNFFEIARVENGVIKTMVRNTEYAVLEDTLARRTFDESGDYAVRDFDLDIREHLISGNNRGIYTAVNGGLETKLAAGMGPGKAYVKGYEIETLGTNFIDVNKARDFDTQNNFTTKFDVGNYVNVTNIFGVPEVGFVSAASEAFKKVNLYDTLNGTPGTENTGTGASIKSIGRAKSKGFQYVTGTPTSFTYGTDAVFRHYLFDINMFTHLNMRDNTAFTTGETITGSTSGATATVESLSTVTAVSASTITVASPGVV